MDKSGKNENRIFKIVLACDSFTAAYSVMLLLFFLPYVIQNGQWVAAGFMPICCLIPFALMPLLYALVHRFDPLLFGRYHLFLPLAALVTALLFVEFWAADDSAGGACRIIFSGLALGVTAIMYRYCSFSVRVRLTKDGITTPSGYSLIFAALGGIAAVSSAIGFYYYDPQTAFSNAAYVVAAVCVILAMVQYLTSYYFIPKLSGRRVQSVKSVFRTFYGGIKYRTFLSSVFTIGAYAIVIALAVSVCSALPSYVWISVAATMVGAFVVGSFACTKLIRQRSRVLTAVMMSFLAVAVVLFSLTEVFVIFDIVPIAPTVIAALLTGLGFSAALRQTRLRFLTIKPHVTSGVVYILIELAIAAGAAIAFAVSAVIGGVAAATGDMITYVYGFAVSVVLGIAAVVTSRLNRSVPPAPGDLSYELTAVTQDREVDDGVGGSESTKV